MPSCRSVSANDGGFGRACVVVCHITSPPPLLAMMSRLRLLAVVALSLAIPATAVCAGTATAPAESFDPSFRHQLAEAGNPGGACVRVVDGRIAQAAGVGVREVGGDAPIAADTVFRIASASRTFAAQLSAMLVDEGKLHRDDPLAGLCRTPISSAMRPRRCRRTEWRAAGMARDASRPRRSAARRDISTAANAG